VYGPFFMLVGFAIENLCKAVLVHRRREELVAQKLTRLPDFLATHDLYQLLTDLGAQIPDAMVRNVLERLYRPSEWAGRYPTPVMAIDLARGQRLGTMLGFYTADDVHDLHFVVRAVENILNHELGDEPSAW
jgi:hypothetical protein